MIKILFLFLFSFSGIIFSVENKEPYESFLDKIMKEQSHLDLRKGLTFMNIAEYRLASMEFSKAIDKNPSSMAYAMYGASLYWLGDVDSSIKQYEEALKKDPNNAVAYQLKGISMARNGNIEDALNNFLKAFSKEPLRADISMNISSVYFSMGHMASAVEYIRKSLKLEPLNPLYHYHYGLINLYLEKYDEAVENFKIAVSLKSDYADAFLWMGVAFEKMEDDKSALKNYLKAINIKPSDFFSRYKSARIYAKQGKIKEALEQVRSSLRLKVSDPLGGLSLFIAYGLSKQSSDLSSSPERLSNPTLKQIYENIMKNPLTDEVDVSVDIVSSEKFKIESASEKLSSALNKKALKKRYVSRSARFQSQSLKERSDEAFKFLEDIQKDALIESNDYNHKINFYMKSVDRKKAESKRVVYAPRDIGNDLGLWVYGNNWMDALSEDLSISQKESYSAVDNMVLGLGNLLYGECEKADGLFEKSFKDFYKVSMMGRSISAICSGNQDFAEELLKKAAMYDPNDKIIKENLKWLYVK